MYSLAIVNAVVCDGSSRPCYRADVAIQKDRIAHIGSISKDRAEKIIDGEGRVLAPGFIDMHSHSDTTIMINPNADSKIRQGVTTEVIGNCGNSLAPLWGKALEYADRHLAGYGVQRSWESVGEYLDFLENIKPALNVAMLVGHGTIRRAVLGTENRNPTSAEMDQMKRHLYQALQDGAFGMSTGLIYPPGFYSETEELIELAKVLAENNGLYASHIRGEGPTLIEAMTEVLNIGQKSKASVHVSHHKATGRPHWGKVKETLAMIDEARSQLIDVTGDMYPYQATNTLLQTFLPRWVHEGGISEMLERLRMNDVREDLVKRLKGTDKYRISWDNILLAHTRKGSNHNLEGKDFVEIAHLRKKEPTELVIDLILEEEGTASVLIMSMCEEDIERVMRHNAVMFGSDGSCLTKEGLLGNGKPHPRNFGTFPRVLGEYVRQRKTISLESAINKMTFLTAKRLGLDNRGLIYPGFAADLVLFDPEMIQDRATYQDPKSYPIGINYVIVNGEIVIEYENNTNKRPGKVLRKGSEQG